MSLLCPVLAGVDTVDCLGICTTALQFGHFPFFPAVAAGVRTGSPQWGQANSIFEGLFGCGVTLLFGDLSLATGDAEDDFGGTGLAKIGLGSVCFGGASAGLATRGFCR